MENAKVILKSIPDKLDFFLSPQMVKSKEVKSFLLKHQEFILPLNLSATILTKLCVILKTLSPANFNPAKPLLPDKCFEGVNTQIRGFVEGICESEEQVKEVYSLYIKLELNDQSEFFGFILSYFLRNKTEEEVMKFFELIRDVSEQSLKEFRDLMEECDAL